MTLPGLIFLDLIDIDRMALLDINIPILANKDIAKAVRLSCACGEYVWYPRPGVLSQIDV